MTLTALAKTAAATVLAALALAFGAATAHADTVPATGDAQTTATNPWE
ncbi:hypothetical protein ACFQV2_22140 [Actinokineospora soli]|uniref:Uncharacterized protein n=1 Tax=Actinokineospora soli TaxID=1048753 RepID=A0ABW2TR31_9PSEU